MIDNLTENKTIFDFPTQSRLEATTSYNRRRGKQILRSLTQPQVDYWNFHVADLSLKAWEPCPPPRNSREAIKPEKYTSNSKPTVENTEEKRSIDKNFSDLNIHLHSLPFTASVRSIRPHTAKKLFVQYGSFKPGAYKMPKPHDHRGLIPVEELELAEFITSFEKDTLNLKFLNQNRQQIWGNLNNLNLLRKINHPLNTHFHKNPPKWESQLYLPKDLFPNREKRFTRYRLQYRDPYEAFLERVELKLKERWNQRKVFLEN